MSRDSEWKIIEAMAAIVSAGMFGERERRAVGDAIDAFVYEYGPLNDDRRAERAPESEDSHG